MLTEQLTKGREELRYLESVVQELQQAELEPGSNLTIELRYIPEGFIIGVAASIITLLIMLLVVYLRRSEADYFEYDDDDEVSEKRESPKQKDKPTSKPQSDNAASQAEAKDKADAVANQAAERSSNSKREAAESKEKQSKPEITNPDASGGIEI